MSQDALTAIEGLEALREDYLEGRVGIVTTITSARVRERGARVKLIDKAIILLRSLAAQTAGEPSDSVCVPRELLTRAAEFIQFAQDVPVQERNATECMNELYALLDAAPTVPADSAIAPSDESEAMRRLLERQRKK